MSILVENPRQQFRQLASLHGVTYQVGPNDDLASTITQLAGDDVQLDENELLILELRRLGHLSALDALKLQAAYLKQIRSLKSKTPPRGGPGGALQTFFEPRRRDNETRWAHLIGWALGQ